MQKTKLKNQIRKFSEYLIVDRGLSKTTVDGYGRSMSIALRRMRKFRPQYPQIKTLILWMHEKKYSYSHITNTSLAIEHYVRFKGGNIRIGRSRKPRPIIKDVLSESEVSRLIQAAKDIREKAMISLLAYSGVRNLEFCRLKVEDVDLGGNHLRVLGGKNRKDRLVNISPECTKILIDYLSEFPRKKGDFLFTTRAKNNPLATCDLRKMLRCAAQRAKIGRRCYPHLMRHSLATNLLHRGASLIMIKDQLGHAFIDSTMIYVTSMPLRMRTEYDYFKPAYL
jgi:site-specific recombinase XerD